MALSRRRPAWLAGTSKENAVDGLGDIPTVYGITYPEWRP
jgi:hypothetical protein